MKVVVYGNQEEVKSLDRLFNKIGIIYYEFIEERRGRRAKSDEPLKLAPADHRKCQYCYGTISDGKVGPYCSDGCAGKDYLEQKKKTKLIGLN